MAMKQASPKYPKKQKGTVVSRKQQYLFLCCAIYVLNEPTATALLLKD